MFETVKNILVEEMQVKGVSVGSQYDMPGVAVDVVEKGVQNLPRDRDG